MSHKQNDIYLENLIEQWREARESWNGKTEWGEQRILDIEEELIDLGINPEDLLFFREEIAKAELRARIDEINRLAVSDKSGSDFDGWEYLDKRLAELKSKMGGNDE
jgi:hypothetical protein